MKPQIELFRDNYRLSERVSGKARNLRIEVRPDRSVTLIYPRRVSRAEALAFFRTRESWVREKLAEMGQHGEALPVPHRWDGSDRIWLHGEERALRLELSRLRRAQVRFEASQIAVFAPPDICVQPARLDAVLRQALIQRARLDALRHLETAALPLGVRHRELRIKDPRTQWGSCNHGAVICLSWRLVMAPPEVFRYVAVHELCHLVHMDHSAAFWQLVREQMPDFEIHKRWLRERGHQLHSRLARRTA